MADTAGGRAGGQPPPADAVGRYAQYKPAIGNHLRGFARDAEAVTALRLGVRLLDFDAVQEACKHLTNSATLAQPRSLLALTARLRLGQALARPADTDAARSTLQEVIAATRAAPPGSPRHRLHTEATQTLPQLDQPPRSTAAAESDAAPVCPTSGLPAAT